MSLFVIREKESGMFALGGRSRAFVKNIDRAAMYNSRKAAEATVRKFFPNGQDNSVGHMWCLEDETSISGFTEFYNQDVKAYAQSLMDVYHKSGSPYMKERAEWTLANVKERSPVFEVVEVTLTVVENP